MNLKKTLLALLAICALWAPASAQAEEFGFVPGSFSTLAENADGTIDELAGTHPYAFTVAFQLKTDAEGHSEGGVMRDARVDLPSGFFGYPLAVPRCPRQSFEGTTPSCGIGTQVGVLRASVPSLGGETNIPLYNVAPAPGVAAQIAGSIAEFSVTMLFSARTEDGYRIRVSAPNAPLETTAISARIWGVPADPSHDPERGYEGNAHSSEPLLPFLTMPTSCDAPLHSTVSVDPKEAPGNFISETAYSLNAAGEPAPLSGCDAVPFSPAIASQATNRLATSGSGLDFELRLPDQGHKSPGGTAETEPSKVVVALPEGMSINPSFAEGISTCSQAQYQLEQLESKPAEGCPEASKIGSLIVHTPLLDEPIEGSLYLAAPYENPFGTLAALYMVARAPERGILIKQAGRVDFNASTGQITSTFANLPPLPFADFQLHFREGARAPLVTPRGCGEYRTVAKLYPFSAPNTPVERTASFRIEGGSGAGPCPSGGTPPFHPGLEAGSINNAAGRYSPFYVRLSRNDAEQEITHFSIKLPPGITGKLAGIPFCSEAQIAAAKAREGTPHGGAEELVAPSCPAASEVGHTLVGAGVGQVLAYVPGKVYLAGPYNGSQLSVVAITAAKAGPFDLGTVAVRDALRINPETAEVFVDATGSDPIPHIISGIPVHLRDVRIYVDRPDFVLNPTSCEPTSTASTLLGSGANFATEADDQPVTVSTRYQAADCANLAFKPKLQLKLSGSTKRGGNPALTAILRPRAGDANAKSISVALPHSEFLDQAHIKTICTRVQFKAGAGNGAECPAGSVYGHATAYTPLLDEPLQGDVYLRSSEHPLPDLVLALHGLVEFTAVGRVDSVNGGIRNSFEFVPDAPISKVVLSLGGGPKSLLENSTNLCKGTHKATAQFTGHNGRAYNAQVALKPQCGKKKARKATSKRHRSALLHELRAAW